MFVCATRMLTTPSVSRSWEDVKKFHSEHVRWIHPKLFCARFQYAWRKLEQGKANVLWVQNVSIATVQDIRTPLLPVVWVLAPDSGWVL